MIRFVAFAYPGDLNLKTGGYGYDRQIIEGLKLLGWTVKLIPLGNGFPAPEPDVLRKAGDVLSELPDDSVVIVDGLAFGVLSEWALKERERLKIVALVHHPLALETGLAESAQATFQETESAALSCVRHVIVTSNTTAKELVANYDVHEGDITVAPPGTTKPKKRNTGNNVPLILSVGSLTRRKGHDVLVSALTEIRDLEWNAVIVGSPNLDPQTASEIQQLISANELDGRVFLAGEADDVGKFYTSADIFALASRYEGYGMVFAEALAHGLPIVACRAGAVPDVVPSEAGFLVKVNDVREFSLALRKLLTDENERSKRSQASAAAGAFLPDWKDTCLTVSKALSELS